MRVEVPGGAVIDLGVTETSPTIGIVDYSRRVTDDFGVTTVVARKFARRMSVRMIMPASNVDAVQRALADLRATPALWVADDRFASLSVTGFYKDFSLDLALPASSYCTLTVEGLAEADAFVDPGIDPAPVGDVSTLQLLQPQTVTDAVLTASSVAETDYPAWSVATAYALGARVIKAATHRIYESAAAGNIGNDPAGVSGKWLDVGPTNRWAMFDQALGSVTSADGSIVVTLDPDAAINAVALLDVDAATVRVQAAGYDRTLAPVARPGMVTFLDMPPTATAVTITLSGAGAVSVGTMMLGTLVGLGTTEISPTAGITDYSRKETDDFGDVVVVERAWAKRMSVRALLRTDALDTVAGRITAVRARPCLWIGDEGTEAVTIYGFFKDFSIEVGENVSALSLSIEGLSAAGKVAPINIGGDVSWVDIVDDDPARPKPQDGADVTSENTAANTAMVGAKSADVVLDELNLTGELGLDNENFVKRMEGVDPVTGFQRATIMVDYMGIARASQAIVAGPGGSVIGWAANEFYWYDTGVPGSVPRQAGKIVDGRWTLWDVYIDKLEVGSVIRQSINPGAVTDSATFTAPDVTITSASETTIIETPFFEVGDALYGKALAGVSFLQDGTSNFDTAIRVRSYIDTGGGYVLVRDKIGGMDVDSGNARFASNVGFNLRLSSGTPARIKITGQASLLPSGHGTLSSSVVREPAIDLFRGQR
jgi:hypothetical protein